VIRGRWIAVLALLALSGAAAAETFMGLEVVKKQFTISGGEVVELAVTERGPIPATAEGVKVEVLGPLFGPSRSTPGKAALVWAVSLAVPKGETYKSVLVEDVSQPAARMVITKAEPKAEPVKMPDGKQLNVLQLRSEPVDITQGSAPWVFQPGLTAFIYRITLDKGEGRPVVLIQLTAFGDDAKGQLRKAVETASKTKGA